MGKVIFITGASRGIGNALAKLYAGDGVTLGLHGLASDENLSLVAAQCGEKGAVVHQYAGDVTDEALLKKQIEDFLAKAGGIDLVFANAGVSLPEDLQYTGAAVARKNMEVNYFGLIHTVLPFITTMIRQSRGHIVAISSISSLRATQNSGAYSASKGAVNLWTEGLRLRLRDHGISVSTLCVGFVDTDMNKNIDFWMPGLISADEAARVIDGAVQRRVRIMTFPWQVNVIWTIFRLMPGFLYDIVISWAKANQFKRQAKSSV